MKFALSTSWNAGRRTSGEAIVSEIKSLGFDEIELNFTLTEQMVSSIARLKKAGIINVIGLHNFCPIPKNIPRSQASPDYYSLSSLDPEERKTAVSETKHTIDTAEELGAGYIVIHAGKVELEQDTKGLVRFYPEKGKPSKFYEMLRKNLKEEREQVKDKFLAATIKSLEELSKYSSSSGVKLGIETRYYFNEIPSFEDMEMILDHFEGSNIYYWHDAGHAQVNENLGICKHGDYLDRFSAKMIGVHLHDVVGVDDHRAPGAGKINFRILAPYIKKETALVLEPHPPATARQVRKAVQYLEKELGGHG